MKKLLMEYGGAILAAILTVPASKLLVPDPAFGYAILVGSTIGALVGKFLHTFLGRKRITRATTVVSLIAWLVLVVLFWAVYAFGWRGGAFSATSNYLMLTQIAVGAMAILVAGAAALVGAEAGARAS